MLKGLLQIFVFLSHLAKAVPHLSQCGSAFPLPFELESSYKNPPFQKFVDKNSAEKRQHPSFYDYVHHSHQKMLALVQPIASSDDWEEQAREMKVNDQLWGNRCVLHFFECYEDESFVIFLYKPQEGSLENLLSRKEENNFLKRMGIYKSLLGAFKILLETSYAFLEIKDADIFYDPTAEVPVKFTRLQSLIRCEPNAKKSRSADASVPIIGCDRASQRSMSSFMDYMIKNELNIPSTFADSNEGLLTFYTSRKSMYDKLLADMAEKQKTHKETLLFHRLINNVGPSLLGLEMLAKPLTIPILLTKFDEAIKFYSQRHPEDIISH